MKFHLESSMLGVLPPSSTSSMLNLQKNKKC